MNKNTRQGLKYLFLLFVLYLFFNSSYGQRVMRYSPLEIKTKTDAGVGSIKGGKECVVGSGSPGESPYSLGLGPNAACGLPKLVRDQHDYEILSGIGMD
jgi:hypothetical protein